MNRRNFLKRSVFISVGGMLMPSALLSACRKQTLYSNINYKGKVIIIGAGASGLYAGYMLKSKGIDFEILEAAATHGGRIGKLSGFADYDIDTGGQWLHGRNSILGDLVQKTNTTVTLNEIDLKYWFNNQIVSSLPQDPFIFEGDDLPDISFKDYAQQKGFGAEYDYIIEAIAGDQGAAASQLSVYWNDKDEENWSAGTEDFKFGETYFDLINNNIVKPILDKIKLNTQVKSIDYSGDTAVIRDANGTIYNADKIIVTVPISILKLKEIDFNPPLSEEKTTAFDKFGMGPGMKVFLKFSTKFYEDALYGGKICGAYVNDTAGKNTSDNVLLAFVMGNQAAYLNGLGSDAAITNALLKELDIMYNGKASTNFLSSSVHNYTNRPFIKGAYGFSTINMGNARQKAAEPVNGKLFFAGEAMNVNGHHQTVHGAVESGYKAVMDLLESVTR